MIEFFQQLLIETWRIFTEAAPYVIFGFLAAGVIKAIVPEDAVARHLGGRSTMAVIKASLFGIPLPLCSCGVIPAAIGLRKQGAGRGPSAAFLVSTPESGVDSIAITWALLDPVMTVIRPIAAFITGTLTGILINIYCRKRQRNLTLSRMIADARAPVVNQSLMQMHLWPNAWLLVFIMPLVNY